MGIEAGNPARKAHPIRWWILLMLFLAITINILDRQVLSLVAPVLREQFKLSNTEYGAIVFCFLLGMTMGQIPVGTMIDRLGARFGFTVIIVGWSAASALHALARSVVQFSFLRYILGLSECGTYSGGVKVIGEWFPIEERSLASGLFNSGSLAGAIVAPPLIVYLMLKFGWPAAFIFPSSVGFLWLIPWLRLYWTPSRHPLLSDAERAQAAAQSLSRGAGPSVWALLHLAPVWGVILMRTFSGPVTHFYWYWLPEYLKHGRGMSLEMIGAFAWMPFFSGGVGNILGGAVTSYLIKRGWSLNIARKTVFGASTGLCLTAMLVPLAPGPASAIALICLASLGINAVSANLIGLMTDLFPQTVLARVGGLTGVGDGLMSMTMMLLTGVVIDRFSYLPVFVAAGLFPLAAFAALFVLVGRIQQLPEPPSAGAKTLEPVTLEGRQS